MEKRNLKEVSPLVLIDDRILKATTMDAPAKPLGRQYRPCLRASHGHVQGWGVALTSQKHSPCNCACTALLGRSVRRPQET